MGGKALRKGIRKQLGYVRRNLQNIEKQLKTVEIAVLNRLERERLCVSRELYRQQEEMYRTRTRRVNDRIVSMEQPHVRPIVRGKSGSPVEFGSKVLLSVENGWVRIEKMGFDNYNEGVCFQECVERYKSRYGYYPESVHVDKIFRTQPNRAYCKERGIRMSGAALGRPSSNVEKNREARRLEREDERARNPVEGKFGNMKRKYGLDRIFAKRASTSECSIAVGILLLNLEKVLRKGALFFVVAYSCRIFNIRRWKAHQSAFTYTDDDFNTLKYTA